MIALRRSMFEGMFEGGCYQEGALLLGVHDWYFLLATSIYVGASVDRIGSLLNVRSLNSAQTTAMVEQI